MPNFLVNAGLLAWIAAIWVGCGYGFARALQPRRGRWEAVLLAPLVGTCLLGLLGLLELAILLVPLRPWANVSLLLTASALLARFAGRKGRETVGLSAWELSRLCLVPVVALVAVAGLYRAQGFHLLVGTQDQVQYCDNARHILESAHTGSETDFPVPRQDHLVAEYSTRFLPYWKNYRRGAEVVLATTAALAGVGPEAAFPLTAGVGLLTLGLALAYLGRRLMRLGLPACAMLQLLLLGGTHVMMLHYQGSLPHLLALPAFLLALPVTLRALRAGWGTCLLSGLLVGSLLSFYYEPVMVVLAAPLALYVAWRILASPRRGRVALRLVAVLGVAAILSPLGAKCLWQSAAWNVRGVYAGLTRSPEPEAAAKPAASVVRSPYWGQTGTVLGVTSYFDNTQFNVKSSRSYAEPAWRGCAACALLWGLGITGLVRRRRPTTRLFALVLLAWAGGAFVFVHSQDYLRFFRGIQYSMPYVSLGLVLLARAPTRPAAFGRWARWSLVWPVRLAVVLFLAVNLYTVYRTARYTVARDAHTDPTLFRFNPVFPEWVALRRQLAGSQDAPVLLSGYQDTIRPQLLSIGTRPAPHFLGESISRFWPLPKVHDYEKAEERWQMLGTRVSLERYCEEHARQHQPWEVVVPEYLERSSLAMVPPGHGYPAEWEPWRDVFPPLVARGHPYCDVVHKTRHAATLSSVGRLRRDERGPYRLLESSATLTYPEARRPVRLLLRYDGAPSDVELYVDGVSLAGGGGQLPAGQAQTAAVLLPGAKVRVGTAGGPVRLREVKLEEVK